MKIIIPLINMRSFPQESFYEHILVSGIFFLRGNMKTCFKCNQEKPIDEFYKHPGMADGHLGKCKDCNKKDTMDRYRELIQDPQWHIKERARGRKKFHRLYKDVQPKEPLEQSRRRNKNYKENYPEKYLSHYFTANARRNKRLIKQPCEKCGKIKVQAHHEDYSKPLDIRWLCVKHHNERHVELREQKLLESSDGKD